MSIELPKAYIASDHEPVIHALWKQADAFRPTGDGTPYCIVMPPPNRTGVLHMGHATMLAIQDTLIRYHRMLGDRVFWVPGSDHAAIATQVKVEQLLKEKGYKDPRRELGREAFLEEVRAFAQTSRDTIVRQVEAMGSSCDWAYEKYTLDEERNRAVFEMFRRMYEDGIIERGYRLVNWDPQFQTTLSDDEVLTKETTAKLYTFRYAKDFPIVISTTRPETKFGDTAVAVHPSDERYAQYIGQTFEVVFCGKSLTIQVIGDEAVDPAFGTGALGVTPAHSQIDWDMMERHGLRMEVVIGEDGRLLPVCGEGFAGLTIVEAREQIAARLEQDGLLEKVEDVAQNLPVAERGGAPVEQLPKKQWFVRVNKPFALRQNTLGVWKKGDSVTLKELMIEAVQPQKADRTQIIPERFEKTYFHWVNNLRDWCISRQIWFGHRIPVWQKDGEERVSITSPGEGWVQDSDTLDTWFSSGMWTFSVLGWPDTASVDADGNLQKTGDLKLYHPTQVLETGYDILFFWVARMILMSTYALGEVPFRDVYLHGLVRDEQGRKMSKSLGNSLDPLELIPRYGTDAVRLSVIVGSTPGQDLKLSEAKIEGLRNFSNKLWNISRFVVGKVGDSAWLREDREYQDIQKEVKTLADAWILERLVEEAVYQHGRMDRYELSSIAERLATFTWDVFADWYIEIAKVEGQKEAILAYVLRTLLKMWHPFMPFVTEAIWQQAKMGGELMTATLPFIGVAYAGDGQSGTLMQTLQALVTDGRRLRAEQGIEPAKKLAYQVVADAERRALITENSAWITRLLQASSLEVVEAFAGEVVATASGACMIGIVQEALGEEDRARLAGELAEAERYLADLERRMANREFMTKAPERVVQELRQKHADTLAKVAHLKERLGARR